MLGGGGDTGGRKWSGWGIEEGVGGERAMTGKLEGWGRLVSVGGRESWEQVRRAGRGVEADNQYPEGGPIWEVV